MVIGKLKYLIGPPNGLYFHPLLDLVQDERNMRVQSGQTLQLRGVTLIHGLERKGKSHVVDFVPHACVLGLPCKVKKLDSNRPLLTVWDCLTFSATQSKKWNNDDDEYVWMINYFPTWMIRDRCSSRMINYIRNMKAKI